MKILLLTVVAAVTPVLAGCGNAASNACVSSFSLGVGVSDGSSAGPTQPTGSADHSLPAPGNQQQFKATSGFEAISGNCAIPQVVALVRPQWTVSDMMDVTISSANDATNGLATCVGTTLTPALVTASYTENGTTKTASTTLTCK